MNSNTTPAITPWESFVTAKMKADGARQWDKLMAAGFSSAAASAEVTAWVRMKAIQARMISELSR